MWRRQKALAALYHELRTIQVFDRLHDYSANADPADNEAYAIRKIRRAQVTAEIERLKGSRSHKDSHKQHAA
jgi:hypothetical protein